MHDSTAGLEHRLGACPGRRPGLAWRATLALACLVLAGLAQAQSVYMEDLTWTELRARLAAGSTTALVPIGGTEQNGPHMTLGKHNARVRELAGRIATQLGHAVVAPVLAYVPEGSIEPPAGHMKFSGTLTIPESAFESVLEATARSLKHHGFRQVVFLGDHGGYQASLSKVARRLNQQWSADPACRVLAADQYYQSTQTAYVKALEARGFSRAEIGVHAGLADTALNLAVAPATVRSAQLQGMSAAGGDGVQGDPRRATAELGELGVNLIVSATVHQIREAAAARR